MLAASSLQVIWYTLIAILPAVVLFIFIYRRDRIEKEPLSLLGKLVVFGVLSGLAAIFLEQKAEGLLNRLMLDANGHLRVDARVYVLLFAFLGIAAVEEGVKLFFVYKGTWNAPAFSHLFDALLYCAAVSLSFAAFENVGYILRYGTSVAWTRALFAVPAHFGFSVFMGVYYGKAKQAMRYGREKLKKRSLLMAFLIPMLLHGCYDACCLLGTPVAVVLFYTVVAFLDVTAYRLVKSRSVGDRPL